LILNRGEVDSQGGEDRRSFFRSIGSSNDGFSARAVKRSMMKSIIAINHGSVSSFGLFIFESS